MAEGELSSGYERETAAKQAKVDKSRAERFKENKALCLPSDPVCARCLAFYGAAPGAKTRFGPALPPDCQLSTIHNMRQAEEAEWWSKLDPEEQQAYRIVSDPVYWAAARLRSLQDNTKPWEPIYYQVEPLCCSSDKILLLFGRQLGKCCAATTYVDLADGSRQQIGSLVGKIVEVVSCSGNRATARRAQISRNIVKSCVRVKTKSGRSLDVSVDHPFMVAEGWRNAEDLRLDDYVGAYAGEIGSRVAVDTVAAVEGIGEHQTYSVSILDTDNYDDQNFSAEGIFTHNTEVLAVKCLFYMDTKPNFKIVLVAPFQTQVEEFFARIRDLYAVSPDIKERVVTDHHNPINEIKLNNGSYIRGFTAGTQTGKAGTDVRGQPADLLVMDEADFLDDDTIVAIFATLIRAANPMLLVSSTPTGRRQKFYTWASDLNEGFRVLHYTSMCAPTWTDELELFYRRNYPRIKFQQEFLAEFGEAASGVFRHQDIDASIEDYEAMDGVPSEGEIYILGCDWNMKGTGGTIIIVGYDPITQKFRAAYKEVVDPTEFTQTYTVNRIVSLNRIWDPTYIYVDYGHGDTQIELLEQYGLEHRETKLHRKVRGIQMGSTLEIRDPLTRRKVKKQAKNLMVDLAVSRLESGQCVLPKGEDHRQGLLGQMRNFQVTHMARSGNKVYTGEEEHLLVAWMLCILGFVMEYSDISRIKHASDVAFLDSNLEKLKRLRKAKKKPPAPKSRGRRPLGLNTMDAINYAGSGLPEGLRKKMQSGIPTRSCGILGRKRWR